MKYFRAIFTIILLLTVGNIYASIQIFTVDGISYYYRYDGDGYNYLKVYVNSVDKERTGHLAIPSSVTYMYTTFEVIRIGSSALSGCTGLTSVQIPYSVTAIGDNAFSGCTGLKSVEIPEGVTSIGSSAFEGCTGLTSIVVSNYNDVYDSRENCNAIIKTATNTLIVGCKNTIIPNSVTSIGSSAFSGLTSITIPKQITSIGAGAFLGCPDLTSIIVENGNTVYDSRDNCNAIIKTATNTLVAGCKNTIIPNSVTSIEKYAFSGCTGLTDIVIPNSVISIGKYAFQNCHSLTSFVIPFSTKSIGDYAFGKTSLSELVVLSSTPPSISENAFYNSNTSNITLYIPYGSANAYKSATGWSKFVNYVEFNQPNNPTHQPLTLYMPDMTGSISRWESSRDGGATWTNIECVEYNYTETDPIRGEVLYRVLKADGTYSNILTINYYDPVPEVIATTPVNETKTVDESVTFTLDVQDDGYTYQWMFNNVAIEGATNSTYSISAIKMNDAGEYSCVVSNPISSVKSSISTIIVNKCPQIITFLEIETKTYGDTSFTLPATTDKGLVINYQSTNTTVATIEGNIVTIKEPGETNIIATQSGNEDYLEASYVSRKLIVKKRSQIIVFDELQDKTYEDLPFTLPATTDKGLTISYQSTNTNVATIDGNRVTIVGAGTTDIIANQQGDRHHYAATPVSYTFTVNRKAQSITFNPFDNVVYGDAQIELNQFTNKNFKITYTSSNTDVATVNGNIITIVKPGVTAIKATQNGNKNYLPAQSVERTLIVNKAEQKIEWYELSAKNYGDEDFALPEVTDKGLTICYTSDNESVATINGNILSIKNAGVANITATQIGDDYYNAATSVTQTLTVSKITQVITFEELPVVTFGDAPLDLNATASSSNEVAFESSDEAVATISGKILTIVGSGICIITASCAGDNNYYTATPVERTLIVNKAEQTITIAPVNGKTYGDEPFEFEITTNNNLPVNLTSSDASVLTVKGRTATIRGAGSVTITAMQEATADYEKAETKINVVINKAALTASVSNIERTYGEANPKIEITYSGFVNDETKEDLDAIPVATCSATELSRVGEYDITISRITDKNYILDIKNAKLIIKKAILSVTPDNLSKIYGDKNPALSVTYSGFKNNENETVLLSNAVAFTKAKTMSDVGEYIITTEGASAVNYDFEYKEGVLAIQKAPLTVLVEDIESVYGAVHEHQIKYEGFKGDDDISTIDVVPNIVCDVTKETPAGTYQMLVTGGNDNNYDIIYSYKGGRDYAIVNIAKAPLVITAEDKCVNYLEDIPQFTVSYDGFVNDDNENILDELPQIICDVTNEALPGVYEIILKGGYDNNYEYILVNGIITINNTNSISAIELNLEENVVYNLNGMRITETENLTRGIYIINGKKVFIK